jgi:alpha-N-arabinofuranosidase
MKQVQHILVLLTICSMVQAKEYHVAKNGSDNNKGTAEAPLLTIQAAADLAGPGDSITVHQGIYREEIVPPRGGRSAQAPIVYRAAPGKNVSIRGSEKIEGWINQGNNVWMVEVDNSFFGDYNPYDRKLSGSWLDYGKDHHLGEVFLNGKALYEKFSLEDVQQLPNTWYTEVDDKSTRIWANFAWANPNINLAEINVRECAIFPEIQGLKYIIIDGFEIKHTATDWAPPDRFQKGAIGTRFGYQWEIRNCRISDVKCVAICIGAVEDYFWDNRNLPPLDTFGHHRISNNIISRCGQGGIVGSYGCVGSIVENNYITETNYKNEFGGAETAAIKLHFAIDAIVRDNYCKGVAGLKHRTKGIWLDWGIQNTRVTGNIISDFQAEGLKLEVGHGPVIIDNNLFINAEVVQWGNANIFVHNLFYYCSFSYLDWIDTREVPYYKPHTTEEAGRETTPNSYDKYFNNIFIGEGLDAIPENLTGSVINHNVFLEGAEKNREQDHASVVDPLETKFNFQKGSNPMTLSFELSQTVFEKAYPLITSEYIGVLPIPKMAMENPDGTFLDIRTDYLGNSVNSEKVMPGPFQDIEIKGNVFKVWPKKLIKR